MKGAILYFALFGGALALFYAAPGIDLWASGLFYAPGSGFYLAHFPPVALLHQAVPWIARALVLFAAFAAAWLYLLRRPLWRFDRKALLFITAAFLIGPGLLVNTVLKDHWGRARPEQIAEFGGLREFTPAAVPADQCPTNCSFPSGDAALAFGFIAFAFLLPRGRPRQAAQGAALAFGGLVGMARIAAGGHFLSDVMDAGFLVYGTSAGLYWWIVGRDGLASPALMRTYRAGGFAAAKTWRFLQRTPSARIVFWTLATTLAVALSMEFVDRPFAMFFHRRAPNFQHFFDLISELGLSQGYLILCALAFAILFWGDRLPRFRLYGSLMRAYSAVPAFIFAAVAGSGLVVDLIKVLIGRTRPKLLFSAHLFGFTGLAFRADHWSFPSGHTSTIVALAAALWCLWPRHVLFYIFFAAIVAFSRVVIDAHYLSDVLAGAFIAVVTTRAIAWLFLRYGMDLAALGSGAVSVPPPPSSTAEASFAEE